MILIFFFQAEDGIRDVAVTGVQTCALPIYQWHTPGHSSGESLRGSPWVNDFYEFMGEHVFDADLSVSVPMPDSLMEPKGVIAEAQAMAAKRSEERRVGKECRSRWSPYH